MAKDPRASIFNSLKKAAPSLTAEWFAISNKFGWDKQTAEMVGVSVTDESIKLDYSPDMSQKIFDTEYGYKNQTPKPAMREMSHQSKNTIKKAVHKGLSDYLKDSGVIK